MPVKPTYPGVYIQEERSGVQTLTGVATSVAAFLGTAPQGPIGVPTRIFSYQQFEETFGGGTAAGEMPLQVRLFYLNGGQTAWITRLAHSAAAATALLANDQGTGVLTLTARDRGARSNSIQVEVDYDTPSPERTFNLKVYRRTVDARGAQVITQSETLQNLSMDPASPNYVETMVMNGSALVTASVTSDVTDIDPSVSSDLKGSISGWMYAAADTGASVLALLVDSMSGNDATGDFGWINISVNYQRAVPVQLRPQVDWAAFKLAAELAINNALSAAEVSGTVTVDVFDRDGLGFLVFRSVDGPVSLRSATTDDLAGAMRLGVQNGGIETDSFSQMRPVQTGVSARVHNTAVPDFAPALALFGEATTDLNEWQLELVGATYARATADVGNGPLAGASGTLIESAAIARPTADVGGQPAVLGSFAAFKANIQVFANDIAARVDRAWDARLNGLSLTLTPRNKLPLLGQDATLTTNGSAFAAELFPPGASNLSAYPLGAGALGSYLLAGVGGSDGDLPEPSDYDAGYQQLARTADIFNLMVLPRCRVGTSTQSDAQRALLWGTASSFCQERRAFLIIDPPSDNNAWSDVNAVTGATGIDNLRIGVVGDHAAIYWPRLRVSDDRGQPLHVDPSGAMAGLYARTDERRGVWKAPAGIGATLSGVRGLEHQVTDRENGVTNLAAVNTNRTFSQGIVSWGGRTLAGFENSGEDDWRHIPVRRTALMIEESLYRGLKFAVFEPNAEPLWGQIRLAAGAFMNSLFRQGAFKGTKSSDAYFVSCDSTTTTANDINLGIVNVRVGFAPLKPAEFVIVTIRQMAAQIEV